MEHYGKYKSPVGMLYLLSCEGFLTGLWPESSRFFPTSDFENAVETDDNAIHLAHKWLDEYFSGSIPSIQVPIRTNGTAFRKTVWNILLGIPYATLRSYKSIAEEISPSMAAQAVGNAVGHNPVSIIVPCHRVVGNDGSLVGYGAGLDMKKALLRLEIKTMRKLGKK